MSFGYHSYRGRGSKLKVFLAILLALVILAALAFLALQRYISYDADGRPFFRLPEDLQSRPAEGEDLPSDPAEGEDPAVLTPEDLGLDIQAPAEPAPVQVELRSPLHILASSATPLTRKDWIVPAVPYDSTAVTVKDAKGKVYFDSDTAVGRSVTVKEDTATVLEQIDRVGIYSVARLCCFRDGVAAAADVRGMGLMNTGGYIFYDGHSERWLDPGKEAARAYLCGLAREAAELGFDEILLTDVSYPTVGKLNKIDYGESGKDGNLARFLEEVRAVLEPYGTVLSIELPEDTVLAAAGEGTGLSLEEALPLVDRVYVRTARPEILEAVLSAAGDTPFLPELDALPETDPSEDGYLVFE